MEKLKLLVVHLTDKESIYPETTKWGCEDDVLWYELETPAGSATVIHPLYNVREYRWRWVPTDADGKEVK